MSIRKTLLAATVATALGLPAAASAITIDGITFEAGAILETMDLFEGAAGGGPILNPDDELVGIGIVNRILDAGNNVLWENGDNGRELTVYFHEYIAEDFSTVDLGPGNPKIDTITFSGGLVEIYSDSSQDFSAAGTLQDGIDSATNGNLWLSLAGSPTGGFDSDTGLEAITLTSVATRFSGNPFEGGLIGGDGLLDVTGGLAAANFDTNTFGCAALAGAPCPDDADKSFTTSGQLTTGGPGAWAFRGTGEVQDFAVPVPAPLLLLGAGIAALGYGSRRKAKAAA